MWEIREIGHASSKESRVPVTLQWLDQEDCVIDSTSVNPCLGEKTVAVIARERMGRQIPAWRLGHVRKDRVDEGKASLDELEVNLDEI